MYVRKHYISVHLLFYSNYTYRYFKFNIQLKKYLFGDLTNRFVWKHNDDETKRGMKHCQMNINKSWKNGRYGAIQVLRNADGGGGGGRQIFQKKHY